jgi:hypothetical protein
LEEESAGEGTLATLSLDEGRVAWSSQTTRNSRVHGSWGDIYDEEIKKSMEYEVDPDSFWAYMIPKVGLASIN